MLSQCPNCRSTFDIDEDQMAIANGLVRCGTCLHVFNSTEHTLTTSRGSSSSAPFKSDTKRDIQREPKRDKATTVDTSPLMDDAQEEQLNGIDQELEAIEAQIAAINQQRAKQKLNKPNKSLDNDLFDFEKIFAESAKVPDISPLRAQSDQSPSYDLIDEGSTHFEANDLHLDSDWRDDQVVDIPQSQPAKASGARRSKLEDDIDDFFAFSDTIQHHGSGAQTYQPGQTGQFRPSEKDGFVRKKKSAKTNTSGQSLEIEDEPLSITTAVAPRRKIRAVPVILGLMGLSAFGFTAYLISNFDTLSQDPVWRPRLEKMCNIVQCELPVTYSTDFLKVTSLSTVKRDRQLEVNAVIYNTNPNFAMPFPDLVMRFTDLNDKLVAELDVLPDEYRQGELARLKEFPSNTSAHITFTLPDPGEDGVNYALEFKYPEL